MQFGLKSYLWFQNRSSAQREFDLKSQVWFPTKICETRGSVTTLLHPFQNRPNTGLGHFKYFIDAVLSRFEIKFIPFLGGKNSSFGNKSSKICHMILFVYHFHAIWLVTLNKPWNLIGFFFSVACSLAGEKMGFKAIMVQFVNKSHQLEPIRLQGPPMISKWV